MSYKRIIISLLILSLALIFTGCLSKLIPITPEITPPAGTEGVLKEVSYNRQAAYNYANHYWDEVCNDNYYMAKDDEGTIAVWFSLGTSYTDIQYFFDNNTTYGQLFGADCAHFVSCCIGNNGGGGLPVQNGGYPAVYGIYGAKALATWILGNGGVEKNSANDLERGDIILFSWGGGTRDHIVIYLGNGKVASHSPCKSPTTDWQWFVNCSTPMTPVKYIHINTGDQLKSDLIVQGLGVNPNHGLPGSNATVSFTIYNQGSGPANAFTTNIRIRSSTGNPTVDDWLFVSLSIPSIPAGGSYNVNRSVTIPTSSPSGTNYIWVILDVYSTANQSDENNDYASRVFTVDNPCTLPIVATNSATEITSTSAKLNATINPNGQSTEAGFFYGTNSNNLTTWTTFKYVGNGYTNVLFYQTITGLLPNTTYYYQVYAEVSCGGVDGEIKSFRTISSPTITTSSPLSSGTQNQYYSTSFSATGGTTPYTWSKTSGTFPSGLSLSSSGVLSGTPTNYGVFSFTIQVMDSGARTGSKAFTLHINQAGVPSTYPPQVTTNNASSITSTSAQLNGNLDSTGGLSCQVWFEYGKTTSYGSSTPKQSKSSTGPFNQAISSLDSNTTYHFRACASNTEGTVYGQDRGFTTHIIGDFNGDCQVKFPDLIIFALAYNTTPGDPKWNSVCDLNKDGIINFPDLIIFAMAYGDVCAD